MEMENQMCFACLQRRIQAVFSDKLVFSYGLSDSALPFGSSAVVQVQNSSGKDTSPQFILEYLPARDYDCLTKYVHEHFTEALENIQNKDENTLPEINQDQNVDRKTDVAQLGYKSSSCKSSGWFPCLKTITALAPIARIGYSSYKVFEELVSHFLSGCTEDHLLRGISLLVEGKATGRDSINFFNLIGIPSVDENSFPGCLRHPNIAPILGMLKESNFINLISPKPLYTLENVLHYSPNALKSEWHVRFLVYQLLSALSYMHDLGVSLGNLCPSNVMLTESCWLWLHVPVKEHLNSHFSSEYKECSVVQHSRLARCNGPCLSEGLFADLKISQPVNWSFSFDSWWRGELSNFEYLIILNKLAGRRWGDQTFHMVMPWVIDFTVKPDENNDSGWRDLTKSKWRLAKGDEQLDFTYSTSEIPHHLSDECLSELAVCSYKARRLPLSVLRMAVRSVYEPNEYPSTMQRLYQWTPDDCIPEFYYDSDIFSSLHSGMSDLAVPSWAASPEDFIKLHRDALESHHVSSQIHHWIDITFGYKLSGQAAIDAKNVMLPSSVTKKPRSTGRYQLFSQPHPARQAYFQKTQARNAMPGLQVNSGHELEKSFLLETTHLQELEVAAAFCEHALHLSPIYGDQLKDFVKDYSSPKELPFESLWKKSFQTAEIGGYCGIPRVINSDYLLEMIEDDGRSYVGYQELLIWRCSRSCTKNFSIDIANDIFSVGCILAELYLRKPLFDATSLLIYMDSGLLPRLVQELPFHIKVLVEECLQRDWSRRPTAKCLLKSPYFPSMIKSCHLFLAPLQLIAKNETRLHYAANFAKKGALRLMGKFVAELCAPYCLALVLSPLSDTEAEWGYIMLKEFLECLSPVAVKALIVPVIRKILQFTCYSHLKVSLLQDSFVREVWNQIGKQAYLETIHPLVISNLFVAPHRASATAASVLLVGSSEELGVPITIHQTILPLIQCFGRGLCTDGVDAIVRIGGIFGENFIIKQILPLLRNVICSCIDVACANKPEPLHSWSTFAIKDCLMALDGFVAILPRDVIVKELIEDGSLHVQILVQMNLGTPVLQVAATSLLSVCQQIGPEFTASHVLPKLKELFDDFAFSQENKNHSGHLDKRLNIAETKVKGENQLESRRDIVLLLYPYFASLLGIEKLRQCCASWLLLEQFLLRHYNWKLECIDESSRTSLENTNARRAGFSPGLKSEYNPAKLLLNGVGWSVPQSQGNISAKSKLPSKRQHDHNYSHTTVHAKTSNFGNYEPWFWFSSPASNWDGPDFLVRVGNTKDEIPWKIKASIVHSVRAHHGALRSFAICRDERTIFSAGVGPGFKGNVQKWDLSRVDCISGYYGHNEVVNDICILPSSNRVASCDGSLHIWNSLSGKLISVFAEFSSSSVHLQPPLPYASKINTEQANMFTFNPLSSGILNNGLDGSLYTSMHHLEFNEKLVMGTGNGCLRFIDVTQGQKLHLWRSEKMESNFPSLISSICSCGSDKMQTDEASASASWIAAGLSSGVFRLLDMRSGNVIASWQAHDGYVTRLAAPEDHLLVSSSLDKTLKIWDLRRNWTSPPVVLKGHNDSISGFSVWGQDVISISRNKIGLSSLCKSLEDGQQRVTPQHLYTADHEQKNMSALSCISILPLSRLFLVGTEDGFLKICS